MKMRFAQSPTTSWRVGQSTTLTFKLESHETKRALPTFLLLFPFAAVSQITLPSGTQLPVATQKHIPMKVGAPIQAKLLYPVYAGDQLTLPAQTVVNGTVVALAPDHNARIRARLGGDFTPFHTPIVRFDSLQLQNGITIPISTGPVTDGAPIYRLVAPPPVHGSLFHRTFLLLKSKANEQIRVFTAPEKGDRALQFLYRQLPYHPERIATGTAWTAETSALLTLPTSSQAPSSSASTTQPATPAPLPTADVAPTWIVQAYLTTPISSESSKPNDPISASVAEPILNPDGSIAVPQGSLLTGEVTQARPARKFSRAGELRFSFRQLQLPGHDVQSVRASLTAADSSSAAQLAMDSEGQVKPKSQDKLIVPFILLQLAGRPLDRDRGDHMLGKDAVASNSLGLVGFIIGTAARQPNIAAGFGYYGAAVSIYQRIFSKGKPVSFARDTRVVIQTTPTRAAAIKPIR